MHLKIHNNARHLSGKKQSGVAIITALLIVTIAATVSITISSKLQLDIRRTGNLIALDQANIYVSFIEKFTEDRLKDPTNFANLTTVLREEGKFEATYPVENGTVQGKITDLNSCINVNSVLGPTAPDPLVQARLKLMFANNNIPAAMISAIIDWIDPDLKDTNPPAGAEDGHYLNIEQPYRTANQLLSSITELRLIKGADNAESTPSYATYNSILRLSTAFREDSNNWPSLCALKPNATVLHKINVNTASKDVLLSLSSTMTAAIADDIIACRGASGAEFTNIGDFTSCSSVKTIITGGDLDQLGFTSQYFLLETKASVGDAKLITYSIILRDSAGKTEILSRTQRTL